jgi:enoyl-CoA hydratase/carnithine racemase
MVILQVDPPVAIVALNDPAKRNAMNIAMFDALDDAVRSIAANDSIHIVLLRGEGSVFCAGFDLAAALNDVSLMEQFILRLSGLNRSLRRMPQVVVAAVQGVAIAGGCAILSACEFVFAARDAKLGYPVHRIGVSPAVTIPTLQQTIGRGAARSLLMGGELIDAEAAHRLGLVTHLSESSETVFLDAMRHCHSLAAKGPHALRATKAWLNELDGSFDDAPFDQAARGSASIADSAESRELLASWQAKRSG